MTQNPMKPQFKRKKGKNNIKIQTLSPYYIKNTKHVSKKFIIEEKKKNETKTFRTQNPTKSRFKNNINKKPKFLTFSL